MNAEFSDRMKAYEYATRYKIPRRTYTIIRLDGRSFSVYTKNLDKPFDSGFISDMQETAKILCANISGTVAAFVQSDEISLILCDFQKPTTQSWFDGNIQKMASVSAGIAASNFNFLRMKRLVDAEVDVFSEKPRLAEFDARVYSIPDKVEVYNYLLWRQIDTTRNATLMAAQAILSHREMQGKKCHELLPIMEEKGVIFDEYPKHIRLGTLLYRNNKIEPVVNKKTNESLLCTRWFWDNYPHMKSFRGEEGKALIHFLIPDKTPLYVEDNVHEDND